MALASLLNIPATDEERLLWSFAHQDQHVKIANAVFQQDANAVLPIYVLDPMPSPKNHDGINSWLRLNQSAHNDFSGLLGIDNNDLSSVDWDKPDQVASFIRLHFNEHLEAQLRLGFAD